MKNDQLLNKHLLVALANLRQCIMAAGIEATDVPVPDDLDIIVAADPAFMAAKARMATAIGQLARNADVRDAVLDVESAAYATIAAATDAAWRAATIAVPGPTS